MNTFADSGCRALSNARTVFGESNRQVRVTFIADSKHATRKLVTDKQFVLGVTFTLDSPTLHDFPKQRESSLHSCYQYLGNRKSPGIAIEVTGDSFHPLDVSEMVELRARGRTFYGAYARTALGNLGYSAVVLKLFDRRFYRKNTRGMISVMYMPLTDASTEIVLRKMRKGQIRSRERGSSDVRS
ncbi:hypothetical protein RHS04_05012 [Rhizoctonia solani]|uniref:Uncharacterized protein n=1 Tax=Rhizoctonia solani TaxID=456999 RepID=A0A8H7LML0_9AGAM